jgi:hypothetical protein
MVYSSRKLTLPVSADLRAVAAWRYRPFRQPLCRLFQEQVCSHDGGFSRHGERFDQQ